MAIFGPKNGHFGPFLTPFSHEKPSKRAPKPTQKGGVPPPEVPFDRFEGGPPPRESENTPREPFFTPRGEKWSRGVVFCPDGPGWSNRTSHRTPEVYRGDQQGPRRSTCRHKILIAALPATKKYLVMHNFPSKNIFLTNFEPAFTQIELKKIFFDDFFEKNRQKKWFFWLFLSIFSKKFEFFRTFLKILMFFHHFTTFSSKKLFF